MEIYNYENITNELTTIVQEIQLHLGNSSNYFDILIITYNFI
jgi:hypothetical protein